MFQLLNFLLICPLIGALVIAFTPSWNVRFIKTYALFISITNFIASLSVWLLFDTSTAKFQFVDRIAWLPFLNMNVYIGIDGISLFFILLTTLLIFLCILISWTSVKTNIKEFLIAFLVMEFFLIGVFSILDLLLFYIFFESILIPMYLIVGV
jgi:NADH:ubiquinone oxidoreductase subunit 4 (subunit M)